MTSRRILGAIAGLMLSAAAGAADFKPDPSALIKDLEAFSRTEERMTMVLWMPTEFWRASLEASGKVSPQQIDRAIKELDSYVVLAVSDGVPGLAGTMNFTDPEVLRSSVTIEDMRGNTLSALPDKAITSGGLRTLIQMMRPMFANMFGDAGSHLAIVVFAGSDGKGHHTVEATREGTFVVHAGSVALRYRLPLGSLLPPAIDAKSGETFPGNYHFNPFTGDRLDPAAPAAADPHRDAPAAQGPGTPKGD